MDSNRDIVQRIREALDYQAATQAGRTRTNAVPLPTCWHSKFLAG